MAASLMRSVVSNGHSYMGTVIILVEVSSDLLLW